MKRNFDDGAAVTDFLYHTNPLLFKQLGKAKIKYTEVLQQAAYNEYLAWLHDSFSEDYPHNERVHRRRELYKAFFAR